MMNNNFLLDVIVKLFYTDDVFLLTIILVVYFDYTFFSNVKIAITFLFYNYFSSEIGVCFKVVNLVFKNIFC
jgi:hypothetical protein